ncbi:MAG TPA: CcdC protein domain-containing protein, partial [Bryobacteraceae bacterium]|nr:CcdC protein domain-containing protein [Bryobacteraceae bacterium]
MGRHRHLPRAVALADPLLVTSRLVRQGDIILMQRSNAFFIVIIVLAAIRLLSRGYLDTVLTVERMPFVDARLLLEKSYLPNSTGRERNGDKLRSANPCYLYLSQRRCNFN